MVQYNNGSIRVVHREFVGFITTSGNRNNTPPGDSEGSFNFKKTGTRTEVPKKFPQLLNPQNPNVFSWLSKIAGHFQEFKYNDLLFEYVSTSSSTITGSNPVVGSIICAVDYNSETINVNPWEQNQLENYDGTITARPSDNLVYKVNTKGPHVLKQYFIRQKPGDVDDRFNNLGKLYIGISGTSTQSSDANVAQSVLGKLYVIYDILLMKPKTFTDPVIAPDLTPTQADQNDALSAATLEWTGNELPYSVASVGTPFGQNQNGSPLKALISPVTGDYSGIGIFMGIYGIDLYNRIDFPWGTNAIIKIQARVRGTSAGTGNQSWTMRIVSGDPINDTFLPYNGFNLVTTASASTDVVKSSDQKDYIYTWWFNCQLNNDKKIGSSIIIDQSGGSYDMAIGGLKTQWSMSFYEPTTFLPRD